MNCLTECLENQDKPFDPYRANYCELCPTKQADEKFKAEVENEVFYRVGKNKFGFESLLSSFYGVMRFEELPPDKMTASNCYLNYLDYKCLFFLLRKL